MMNAATRTNAPVPSVSPVMPSTSCLPIPVSLIILPNAPPAPVIARMIPDCVHASFTRSLKDSSRYGRRQKNPMKRPRRRAIFLSPINMKNVCAAVPLSRNMPATVPRRMMKMGKKIRKIPSSPDGSFFVSFSRFSSSLSSSANALAKSFLYSSRVPRYFP